MKVLDLEKTKKMENPICISTRSVGHYSFSYFLRPVCRAVHPFFIHSAGFFLLLLLLLPIFFTVKLVLLLSWARKTRRTRQCLMIKQQPSNSTGSWRRHSQDVDEHKNHIFSFFFFFFFFFFFLSLFWNPSRMINITTTTQILVQLQKR